jgi:hypothetical protein
MAAAAGRSELRGPTHFVVGARTPCSSDHEHPGIGGVEYKDAVPLVGVSARDAVLVRTSCSFSANTPGRPAVSVRTRTHRHG